MKRSTYLIVLLFSIIGITRSYAQCDASDFSFWYDDVTENFYLGTRNGKPGRVHLTSLDYGDGSPAITSFAVNPLVFPSTGAVVQNYTYGTNECGVLTATISFTAECAGGATITLTTPIVIDIMSAGGITETNLGCGNYSFTADLAALGIVDPLWGFGDGGQSTAAAPTHSYSSNGVYVVTVQDENDNGCARFIEITVTGVPESNFNWTGDCTTNEINFDAVSTTGTYSWDFGDSNTSSSADPTHTYSSPGEYLVSLTVTEGGCSSTTSLYVYAGQPAPTFTVDNICEGEVVSPSNLPAWADTYSWDFNGDAIEDATGYLVTHVYTPTFTGGSTETATITLTTTTGGCPPVSHTETIIIYKSVAADFAYTVDACNPLEYVLTPTESDGLSYIWTFTGDPSGASLPGSSFTQTFSSSGDKDITLTVTNGPCVNEITQAVTVLGDLAVNITSPTTTICGSGSILLTSELVNSLGSSTYTYSWHDGTSVVGTGANFLATTSGTYTLTVTDATCGHTATASETITILNLPEPTAETVLTGVDCPGAMTGSVQLDFPADVQAVGYTVNGSSVQTGASYTVTGLPEGPFVYTVAYDGYPECTYVGSVEISYTGPEVSTTSTSSSCSSGTGSITLTSTGAISWVNWKEISDPGTTIATGTTYSGASAGMYIAEASVDGCVLTTTGEIAGTFITVNHSGSSVCDGGTTEITLSASTADVSETYTYTYASGQSGAVNNLSAGSYLVTVTGNSSGCSTEYAFTVTEAEPMAISFITNPVGCSSPVGDVEAVVTGGTGAFNYDWGVASDVDAPVLEDVAAGSYTVTVTDATTGCTVVGTQALVAAPPLSIANVEVVSCEATVHLTVGEEGTGPYIYTWIATDASDVPTGYTYSSSNATINNLTGGIYTVTVEDALGCIDTWTQVTMATNEASAMSFSFVFLDTDFQEPEPDPKQEYDDILAENMVEAADFIQQQLSECAQQQASEQLAAFEQNCFNLDGYNDKMVIKRGISYEQYMLYYYDRAGNLTKTVPPEGVEFLSGPDIEAVKEYRKTGTTPAPTAWVPPHRLATTYEYNALGQLKSQKTPDGGETRFIYDGLQRLRFSQNARQAAEDKFSYMKYDELGRVREAGESDDAGDLEFNYNHDPTDLVYQDNMLLANDANYPTSGNVQVIKTHYSEMTSMDYYGQAQRYIQNRISFIERDDDGDPSTTTDNYTTYFSYDVHGNAEWIIQVDPMIGRNYIRYEYDLISGNVLKVAYNEYRKDRFFHRYAYDADNRLATVETSRDGYIWDRDGEYDYFDHGPLRSLMIGEDNIQKLDYVYTIQGWMKAINNPNVTEEITKANTNISSGLVLGTSDEYLSDAFAMTLGYYNGDFVRTDAANEYATISQGNVFGAKDLYNGNISSWNWKTATGDIATSESMTMAYTYDNLQRIKSVTSYTVVGGTPQVNVNNKFNAAYSFDRNGSLQSLTRNDQNGVQMDNLEYYYQDELGNQLSNSPYDQRLTNQLNMVRDLVGSPTNGDNGDLIDDHTYEYDQIGNLIKDIGKEEIDGDVWDVTLDIDWNVDNKVGQITKTRSLGAGVPITELNKYHYDAMGVRIGKTTIGDMANPESTIHYTRYVLDAQGNTMGVYQIRVVDAPSGSSFDYMAELALTERPIYGADRLGMDAERVVLQTWEFNAGDSPIYSYDENGTAVVSELTNWISPLLKSNTFDEANLCQCEIRHTRFDYDGGTDTYSFTDEGPAVQYYGKTKNGVAVGEKMDGTLDMYATIAENYLGNQKTALLYNIENELIKGTENLVIPYAESKPIIARVPSDEGKYHMVHLNSDQHPVLHKIDMTATGWTPSDAGLVTDENILLDDQYVYGSHMALLEDHLNERNLLYLTRYIPTTDPSACMGEMELVYVEITPTSISAPVYLTRIETGDENGLGELQLSKDATQLVYYNRRQSIAGFAHRMVELNVFGLSGDHTLITTHTPIVRPSDYSGTYGKSSVDFTPNANLFFSQNGIYEENETSGTQDGSEKQVIYYNETSMAFEYTTPDGTFQYNEVRRGINQLMYVPTEEESDQYASWLATDYGTPVVQPITPTSGFELLSSLPSQPHTVAFTEQEVSFKRSIGYKHYEISDHLGNVRYVIGDMRVYQEIIGTTTTYTVKTTDQQIAWTDYYPYGMILPGRHSASADYRYGFQGQEKDDELKGAGNSMNYKFRMHDARTGRFFCVDPLAPKYPWYTPYQFSGNKLIDHRELEGLEEIDIDQKIMVHGEEMTFDEYFGRDVLFPDGKTVAPALYSEEDIIYRDGKRYWKTTVDWYKRANGEITFGPENGAHIITEYPEIEEMTLENMELPIDNADIVGWATMSGECYDKACAQGKKSHDTKTESRIDTETYKGVWIWSEQDVWNGNDGATEWVTKGGGTHNELGRSYNINLSNNIEAVVFALKNHSKGAVLGVASDNHDVNNENASTNHFVYVYGMGNDENGNYFIFADNGTNGSKVLGNKMYIRYNETIGWYLEGTTKWSNRAGVNHVLRVTEFRLPIIE